MEILCRTCRWWHSEDGQMGQCRLYPPEAGIYEEDPQYGVWPYTWPSDWCAQHSELTGHGAVDDSVAG